ncbi:2-amino-4-hydroxy-6-hydroxymethyldihydropteridine diphosphokinase [Cellulomonas persica]|uniref:Bifunctional folate synthesis protein n=1 Tax=Cellulomonas persica TaxID=76861 RepID=A0A510UVC6_9CELL|nr:2-amino-4-hydroxy-6-hydroxymethyldihydropteridine diphosphokinase [Cellulomonas persica]GEK18489.1 hypothetical protein CPE01_22220 [Cellulomonas persica]
MSDVTDAQGHRLDQIRLVGISATGYHGVFEHERREGQTFVVDVVVHLDTRRAAARDDLAHTLDYGTLAQQVVAVIEGPPADLIETVAERIAATVLADGAVTAVDVSVHKPQAPITVPFGDVVVEIRRDRSKLPAAEPHRPEPVTRAPAPAGPPPRTAALPIGTVEVAAAPAGQGSPAAAEPAPAPAPLHAEPPAAPPGAPAGAPAAAGFGATPIPAPLVDPAAAAAVGPLGAAAVAPPLVPLPPPGDVVTRGPLGGDVQVHPADEQVGSSLPFPSGDATQVVAPFEPDATQVVSSIPFEPDATQVMPFGPGDATQVVAPVPLDGGHDAGDVDGADDGVVEGEIVTDRLDEVPDGPVGAVLALGANLGNAQETLRTAVGDLDRTPGIDVIDVSPLARTAPVGGPEQPDFLNAVVLVRTTLSPRDLLRATQAVEQRHGRERTEHWGPRTLDVDIVVYGSVLAVTDDLELPHPRAHERAFVLQPWAQVDPAAVLPGLGGGPVAALAATAPDREGLRWLALDWLTAPVPAAQWEEPAENDAQAPPAAPEA